MNRKIKLLWGKLANSTRQSKGMLILLFIAFSCMPLQAMQKTENCGVNSTTKRLSILSLQDTSQTTDSLVSKEKKDAFEWQNAKHFESIVAIFEDLADRELTYIIQQLIEMINSEHEFFDRTFRYVVSIEQRRIFEWMNESVLTRENYQEELSYQRQQRNYNDDSSYESDDGESLTRAIIKAYEQGEDSKEDSEKTGDSGRDEDECYDNCDVEEDEQELRELQDWQIAKLKKMLSIKIKTMEDFTKEAIHMKAIKRSLKEHTHGGGNMRYSWLLNDTIEGTLSASEDFASLVYAKVGVPRDLIANIFGGLWFNYDWEEFEFDEPLFLEKTYIKTLKDLQVGRNATDVKSKLLNRIRNLFTFNQDDFDSPFNGMRQNYEKYNKNKNWLAALIEWSVYSTYRKVFANPDEESQIKNYTESSPALSVFQVFNRERYLLKWLNNAYKRAYGKYTKVYPHPDTKRIVFGPISHPNRAELDIQTALSQLKTVGKFLEPYRPRKKENVFVPQIYFVVSSKPNQASHSDGQQFFHVPLSFDELPRRPLTRENSDGIFSTVSEEEYFKQVRADVLAGNVLQGKVKEEAEAEINKLINGAKVNRNSRLVHSERGVMQTLRKPANVEKICNDFAKGLQVSCGSGLYTVHGVTILGYSTNTVCPCCTPTLITLQNPYIGGGFLNLLVQKLNAVQGEMAFKTTGYIVPTVKHVTDFWFLKQMCSRQKNFLSDIFTRLIAAYCWSNNVGMDWTQFRLNIFITASIDFDEESRDLAEEGQHSYKGNTNPPKETHNPHGKLFFPDDEIDISENVLLENNTLDPYQRFFYEFVGLDMHTSPLLENPYFDQRKLKFPGVIFSSGSGPCWHNGLMR